MLLILRKILVFFIFLSLVFADTSDNEVCVSPTPRTALTTPKILGMETKPFVGLKVCDQCLSTVHQILTYRKSGASRNSMIELFESLCNTFSDWGKVVCKGYIDIQIDSVLFMMDKKENLTAESACAVYFQEFGCIDPDAKKWVIKLPGKSDKVNPIIKTTGTDKLKIVQLTDLHYDPHYKPGSNSKCSEPLCCESSSGIPTDPKNAAGYWGDYNVCDMPWHSIENLMSEVSDKHNDTGIVYFTGDIISHKSWATTARSNTREIKEIYRFLKKTFKNKPVYPVLGNHEPHPTNFYSTGDAINTSISTQWIFKLAAREWSYWLPNETRDTILRGGFYTVLVKPGFRIVALNSNVCFTPNLWLIYEDEDPYDQLKWLVKVLHEAEKNCENVHIISHIPPGELTCHRQWSYNFNRIVRRFSKTIVAQFNGHTHYDELRVFLDEKNPKSITNVAYNGGSFTTFVGLNPNYRVYDVDANSLVVMDYHQYTYNLTKANELTNKTDPGWFKLYSLKEAYGLPGYGAHSIEFLLERLATDDFFLKQYFRFEVRESDAQVAAGCDNSCLKSLLCRITALEVDDAIACGSPLV